MKYILMGKSVYLPLYMMLECEGILDFKPEVKTKKHLNQSSWKRVAMIKTECDIERYYAWFLEKRYALILNKTLRGAHITIISDRMEEEAFNKAAELFDGKKIKFYYDIAGVRSNGQHWWLKIECEEAKNIRETIGLTRDPYFSFHLTLGYANERNIGHSEYILKTMKLFDPINNKIE